MTEVDRPTANCAESRHEMGDGQRLALSLALASLNRSLTGDEWALVEAYDHGARSTPWPQPTTDQARAQTAVARAVRSSYARLMVLKENYPERWANLGHGWIHELDLPVPRSPWELHVLRGIAAHELRLLRADRRTQRRRLFKRWKIRKLLALLGPNYDALHAFTEVSSSLEVLAPDLLTSEEAWRARQAPTGSGPPSPVRHAARQPTRSRRGGHAGSCATGLLLRDAAPTIGSRVS